MDFLTSGNAELANFQTRMLINQGNGAETQLISQIGEDKAIALAQHNLFNKIEQFGLCEWFDESLILFQDCLDWRLPPAYISRNTTNQRHKIHWQDYHYQAIAAMNQLDLAVYATAKQHFLTQWQQHLGAAAKLQRFQVLNARYQQAIARLPTAEQVPSFLRPLITIWR